MKVDDKVKCDFDYLFTDDFIDVNGDITKHDVYDAHLEGRNYYIHRFKRKNGIWCWSVFSGGGIEQLSTIGPYNKNRFDDLVECWNDSIESTALVRENYLKWHVDWYELFDNQGGTK